MRNALTDKVRKVAWGLWAGTVIAWCTAAAAAGEASNVGKRATYKREAVDAETQAD